MRLETEEILRRLYGVRVRKPRRSWTRRMRGRLLRWVRDHNWSLPLIAVGVGLWLLTHIYYYNNLVSLEFDVLAARAQIEATQEKRSHIQRNMTTLLVYYESYERTLTTEVTETRANGERGAETPDEDGSIETLLGRLNAVAEAYPALRLTEMVERVAGQVIAIESEINVRISQYNTAVNLYTTAMYQFPGLLFAKSLGFEEIEFWEPHPENLEYTPIRRRLEDEQ